MSQQQQQQGNDDQEFLKMGIITIICLILVIAVIATQQYRLNAVLGAITWVHILPFAMAGKYLPLLTEIPILGPWIFGYSVRALSFLEKGGFAVMDPTARNALLIAGGRAATVIYGGLLVWIAVKGNDFRVDQKYRTLHNLESMIHVQSEDWVTSRIARHINPLKKDEIDARRIAMAVSEKLNMDSQMPGEMVPRRAISVVPGTWNRSMRPEEWLISNGLAFDLDRHRILASADSNSSVKDFEFKESWEALELEEISEALSVQLRAPWRGAEHLSPSLRAIFAIMALYYAYDTKGGDRLMNELGLLADATRVKRKAMDAAILAEEGMMAKIDKIAFGEPGKMLAKKAAHHAYVESAFPTMMAIARKDRGVLPPAAFLWLKAEDRLMWYILNNVGNEAIMVEAAGALAHSRAENQLSKPIRRPAVYQASRAILEDYLDMTEERIVSRRDKAIRRRTPGDQLNKLRDDIMSEPAKTASSEKEED
ncbi:hypothetical protein KUV57_13135 [Epibacterium sp. DP7N7-1]|nr:hypothetical protein [Epibacterium sp. DP7N7-1]